MFTAIYGIRLLSKKIYGIRHTSLHVLIVYAPGAYDGLRRAANQRPWTCRISDVARPDWPWFRPCTWPPATVSPAARGTRASRARTPLYYYSCLGPPTVYSSPLNLRLITS